MAQNLGEVASGVVSGGPSFMVTAVLIIGGIIVGLILLSLAIWFFFFKKNWNLTVEIKQIRNDGGFVGAETAKGLYDSKKGEVLIKRKGLRSRPVRMKAFDIRRFLQGEKIITVLQLGPEEFIPVLNDSYKTYIDEYEEFDDKTGESKGLVRERHSVLDIQIDSLSSRAWGTSAKAAAKNAYSIKSFMSQFQTPIAIGIVVICTFVGFAILWTKLSTVCGA